MVTENEVPQRDHEQALRIAGGSEQLVADLYARFRGHLPVALDEMRSLLARADWEGLREAVHRLSGAAASCALPRCGKMLQALGDAAHAADPDLAARRLAELEACARDMPDQIG